MFYVGVIIGYLILYWNLGFNDFEINSVLNSEDDSMLCNI